MRYELKSLEGLKKKMDIHISPEEVQRVFIDHYKKAQKKATIPGYRKGKVPLDQVRQFYKKEVTKSTVMTLIEEFYPQALKQAEVHSLPEPAIDLKSPIAENKSFVFSATFEVAPIVNVDKDWTPALSLPSFQVTEKDIDQGVEAIRKASSKLSSLEGKTALKLGDSVQNDSLAQTFGHKNMKDLRAFVRDLLHQTKQEEIQQNMRQETLQQLTAQYPLSLLPESAVKAQEQNLISLFKERLKAEGMPIADIKKYIEKQKKNVQKVARQTVHSNYLLLDLVQKLNFTVSSQEIQLYLQKIKGAKPKDEQDYIQLRGFLLKEKTLDYLIKRAISKAVKI